MKRILFILFIIILAGVGMLLAQGQSTLIFTYAQWTIQIQMWLVILAILIFAVLYKLIAIICCWLCHLPKRWHAYRSGRRTQQEQEEQQTLQQAMQELKESTDLTELKNRWQRLSSRWRHRPECATAYITHSLRYGGDATAAEIIEWQLAHEWQDSFAKYYGLLPQNAEKRLKQVNRWLQQRPHDTLLLLTAGRLAISAEQWGKAEQYLQQSLAQHPTAAAYLELATVQQQLGKTELAWRSYQAAGQQERVA